jgi:hypothetical protein
MRSANLAPFHLVEDLFSRVRRCTQESERQAK